MTLLGRRMPRDGEDVRPFGAGQPMWMLAAQVYLLFFLVSDYGMFKVNPKPHILLNGVFLAAIVLFAPRGLLRSMRLSIPLTTFLAWWVASFAWTPMLGDWVNRSVTQLSTVAILSLIASVLPWDRLLGMWLGLMYGMLGYTIFFTATHYSVATTLIDAASGQLVNAGWRGPFDHKNTMAAFMIFGLSFVLAFEKNTRRRRVASGLMIMLVLLSRSGTGGACLATVLLSIFWTRRYIRSTVRRGSTLIVMSFLVSIVGVGVIASFVPSLLKLYGKDVTLSGRTEIWSAVLAAIRQKPLTGYSFGGVWIDPTREPTFSIIRSIGFIVFHAHNGPLELMLELGIVGLVLYLWNFFVTMGGGWKLLRVHPQLGEVVVAFCVLILVGSFSEVFIFGPWFGILAMLRVMTLRAKAEGDPRPKRRYTRAVAAMYELERTSAGYTAPNTR